MKTIKGDLIQLAKVGAFDVIIHGCNCQNIMGAGIAYQIAKEFPEVYEVDTIVYEQGNAIPGNYSSSLITRPEELRYKLIVYNAYTQRYPGPFATYEAIQKSFDNISRVLSKGRKVGIPMIGCGIGGLEWDKVHDIIDNIMKDFDITVVEYEPNQGDLK